MRSRTGTITALLALTAALAVVAAAYAHPERGAALAQAKASCRSATIGIIAPLTGNASFLGQEQLTWIQLAMGDYNKQFHSSYKLEQGDSQLDIALARTVGQKQVSNARLLAIIGPSTSGGVIEVGKVATPAHLAMVSPSATRDTLTNGDNPTFFRVVPHDAAQARDDANFMVSKLKATRVFVISSQEPYGQALGGQIKPLLEAKGVKVDTDSVDPDKQKDYSAFADKTKSDTEIVYTPWQVAASAQTLSQQLLEKGKKAKVFGTDGTYDPTNFHPKAGYVSTFAPDIHFSNQKVAKAKTKEYTSKFHRSFGSFGPPSYMAAWVTMQAIDRACKDGKATRPEVVTQLAKTNVKTIYGTQIRFTADHEIAANRFYIYKILEGKYSLAG
jgi:branched-chain amino acid transport system substrate-binding protein